MKRFSRRTILRGLGAAIALPLLESLAPRSLRAEPTATTKRFIALFFPNGTTMWQDWQLGGSGTNYTMGTAHGSLLPFQSQLSMFTNLDGNVGGAPDHSRGTAEFLTAAQINDQTTPQEAISIDQAIADAIDPPTPIRSLHLGPFPYPGGPPSDTGWPSGYNTYISWASPTVPNAPLESALTAFNQVFVPSGTDPALADKRIRLRQSVLDHTIDQIDSMNPRLGTADRQKLDEYLTAVREVEKSLQQQSGGACGNATAPGAMLPHPEHTKAMLDVIVLALRCDATRIITYSMDYGFGNKDFDFLGLGSYRHHNLSHSGTAPEIITVHKAIVSWYMDQFAYLLGEMAAVDELGATLLDKSVVYMSADVGDGWSHSHTNLPAMVAGGGAGALNPGRLIDGSGVEYASVLLALANAMDAPLASFAGVSTPFSGL
jgi:uncharacterized protein DUF1552